MILEQVQVTAMAVFAYVVGDESGGDAVVIDPAGGFGPLADILERHGLTIRWIINTHGHWDHTAGNEDIARKTGAGILIHEADTGMLQRLSNRILSRFIGGKGSPEPVQTLADGDVIEVGGLKLEVIHTPGHSEGSVCLYTPGHLFTGDTLFTEGYGRTDLAGGSTKKLFESIRTRILVLPDDTNIWPGHNYGEFPSSTVAEQKALYTMD